MVHEILIGSALFCFTISKQNSFFIGQKTESKCKQNSFIFQANQLIFGGLNINKKYYLQYFINLASSKQSMYIA